MEFVVLGAFAILALVGLIHTIRWLANRGGRPRPIAAAPPPDLRRLSWAQKLLVVEEVLGPEMPAHLAADLRTLMPWRHPNAAESVSSPEPTPSSAPIESAVPMAMTVATAPTIALAVATLPDTPPLAMAAPEAVSDFPARPEATFDLGAFAAPGLAADVTIDDRALVVPKPIAVAAARSRSKLKLLLSFENIIFLLAACLIMGGTLYLVATTWDRVATGWQHLYAETLLVCYGWILLGTAYFVRRRLALDAAAAVLATIAAAMAAAASQLAAAGFAKGMLAGLAGTFLAQALALPAMALLLALHGSPRRLALLFASAMLGLAASGIFFDWHAQAAGAWLLAAVTVSSAALLPGLVRTGRTTFFLATLTPAAAILLGPATLGLPAPVVAPALVALAFACRPAGRIVHRALAIPALLMLIALALGLAHASLSFMVAIAAVGLLATVNLTTEVPHDVLFLLGAGLTIFVALTWTAAFGFDTWPPSLALLDGSFEQRSHLPMAGVGALPWALGAFAISRAVAAARTRRAVEWTGYVVLVAAFALAIAPLPLLTGLGAIAAAAAVAVAYGQARAGGVARVLCAHLLGLVAAYVIGNMGGPTVAAAAAGAYALVLLATRTRLGVWVGVLTIPLLVGLAMAAGYTHWLPALLLACTGLVLLRPRPEARAVVGPLVLPALVGALLLALFHAGADEQAILAARHLPLVLLLALVPPLAFVCLGRAPLFLTIEVLLGLAGAAAGGSSMWVLVACLPLLAGRDRRALHAAAIGFLPVATLALVHGAPRGFVAPALAAASGLCLWWPLASRVTWPRWLALPAHWAALAVAAFYAPAGAWTLPVAMAVPLLAVGTVPFFAWATIRRGPAFAAIESVLGAFAIFATGLTWLLLADHGLPAGIAAALAALALLLPAHARAANTVSDDHPIDPRLLAPLLALPLFIAAAAALGSKLAGSDAGDGAVVGGALALLPFFGAVAVRRRPESMVSDVTVLAVAAALVALVCTVAGWAGPLSALTAGAIGLALLYPFGERWAWARWLALPLVLAAVGTLYLHSYAGQLPIELWPIVLLAPLVLFFAATWLRRGPRFLVIEVLATLRLLATVAIAAGLAAVAGSVAARTASAAALVGLWLGLACAHLRGPVATRWAWRVVPLATPLALVPVTHDLLAWPAAISAVVAIVVLCVQSRRRADPGMAALGLSAGLIALAWAVASAARPWSHHGDPARHLGQIAIAVAVYGMIMGSLGARISAATPAYLRRLDTACVLLGQCALFLGIGLRAAPMPGEAVTVVLAFGTLAWAALLLAFRSGQGWPFYIAESALGLAYGYLRVRTDWLDGARAFDGLVAPILGFVNLAIARKLRRWRTGLGAKQSEILAYLLPLLAPIFLQIDSPLRSTGSFAAAALYAVLARQNRRPVFGWLAGAMANVGLIPLWLHYDVHSPIAFALPVGTTLMILGRAYQNHLGKSGPLVRSLASLFVFGATSFEMFQFDAPWPALLLALSAIVAVLMGIVWRARAYLYVGFACLLLDILANLTRWSMGDRLRGALFGLSAGMVLLVLGVLVARHKESLLSSYRRMGAWDW